MSVLDPNENICITPIILKWIYILVLELNIKTLIYELKFKFKN